MGPGDLGQLAGSLPSRATGRLVQALAAKERVTMTENPSSGDDFVDIGGGDIVDATVTPLVSDAGEVASTEVPSVDSVIAENLPSSMPAE